MDEVNRRRPPKGLSVSPQWHPRYRVWFLAALILTLAINLALSLTYFSTANSASTPITQITGDVSRNIIAAVPIDDHRFFAATLSNTVLLLNNDQIVRDAEFPNLIGAIAVSQTAQRVYVGTSDGVLTALNLDLEPLSQTQVTGRVLGTQVTRTGGVVVSHGIGNRTGEFYISYFTDLAQPPVFQLPLDSQITGVSLLGDTIVYATANAYVGATDLAGQPEWQSRPARAVTSLATVPSRNQIIVGDDRGQLTLLDGNGQTLLQAQTEGFGIAAAVSPTDFGLYVLGDRRGNVFVFDENGERRYSTLVSETPIDVLMAAPDGSVIAFSQNQPSYRINLDSLDVENNLQAITRRWAVTGTGLALLCLFLAVLTVNPWRESARRFVRVVWGSRTAYLFVLPTVLLLVIFGYYPAISAIGYSFSNLSLTRVPEYVGLDNFSRLLTQDNRFWFGFGNLFLLFVTSILKTITFPLLAAELIFWLKTPSLRYLYRTLFIFPAVVPGLVLVLLWRTFYDPYNGLINQLLRLAGMSFSERAWLGNEATAIWAIIGTGFPWVNAFPFLVYLGGLLNINRELFDAASVDGCNAWQRFWRIEVPLLGEQFRLLLFFVMVGTVQSFAEILILTGGGPGISTYTPALQMYVVLSEQGQFGYASTIGVVLSIIILVGTIGLFRLRKLNVNASE
jgi:ABC-type sugar transport system permease subunit